MVILHGFRKSSRSQWASLTAGYDTIREKDVIFELMKVMSYWKFAILFAAFSTDSERSENWTMTFHKGTWPNIIRHIIHDVLQPLLLNSELQWLALGPTPVEWLPRLSNIAPPLFEGNNHYFENLVRSYLAIMSFLSKSLQHSSSNLNKTSSEGGIWTRWS